MKKQLPPPSKSSPVKPKSPPTAASSTKPNAAPAPTAVPANAPVASSSSKQPSKPAAAKPASKTALPANKPAIASQAPSPAPVRTIGEEELRYKTELEQLIAAAAQAYNNNNNNNNTTSADDSQLSSSSNNPNFHSLTYEEGLLATMFAYIPNLLSCALTCKKFAKAASLVQRNTFTISNRDYMVDTEAMQKVFSKKFKNIRRLMLPNIYHNEMLKIFFNMFAHQLEYIEIQRFSWFELSEVTWAQLLQQNGSKLREVVIHGKHTGVDLANFVSQSIPPIQVFRINPNPDSATPITTIWKLSELVKNLPENMINNLQEFSVSKSYVIDQEVVDKHSKIVSILTSAVMDPLVQLSDKFCKLEHLYITYEDKLLRTRLHPPKGCSLAMLPKLRKVTISGADIQFIPTLGASVKKLEFINCTFTSCDVLTSMYGEDAEEANTTGINNLTSLIFNNCSVKTASTATGKDGKKRVSSIPSSSSKPQPEAPTIILPPLKSLKSLKIINTTMAIPTMEQLAQIEKITLVNTVPQPTIINQIKTLPNIRKIHYESETKGKIDKFTLPASSRGPSKLTALGITNQCLSEIPVTIAVARNISQLNFDNNSIKTFVPLELVMQHNLFSNLKSLSLMCNRMQTIPIQTFKLLPCLEWVDVRGNPALKYMRNQQHWKHFKLTKQQFAAKVLKWLASINRDEEFEDEEVYEYSSRGAVHALCFEAVIPLRECFIITLWTLNMEYHGLTPDVLDGFDYFTFSVQRNSSLDFMKGKVIKMKPDDTVMARKYGTPSRNDKSWFEVKNLQPEE